MRAPAERRQELSQRNRGQDGGCSCCRSQGGRCHKVGAVAVCEHSPLPVMHIPGPAHCSLRLSNMEGLLIVAGTLGAKTR